MKSTMMPTPLSVSSLLEHGRRWNSERTVLTRTESGWRSATFATVADRATRLANALEALGIQGDARVGTLMWNNQEHLEAYLAVPSMGAVLHTANMRLSPAQVAFTINAAEDQILIVDAALLDTLREVLPLVETVHTIVVNGDIDAGALANVTQTVVSYAEIVDAAAPTRTWPTIDENDAASICFTTGTTGDPKGVAYSHRSIVLQCLGSSTVDALRLSGNDRALIAVPMFHATAWCYPYSGFWAGTDLVFLDCFLSPAAIVDAVQQFRITFGNGVPTVWNEVLRTVRSRPDADISSLERIVVGGAAASEALFDGFAEVGATVIQGWGMTETSPLVTVARPIREASPEEARSQRLSQGRVLPGVDIRLVDVADGTELPARGDAIGELELRGPWITGSYLNGVGADRFHDGWLRTGDVGTLDAHGFVRLTDRAKDVIKSGGEWISSVDLENVLAGHPAVAEAAVIGIPDPRWDERPCAFIVLADSTSPRDLRSWLSTRVPKFWIPENWVITESIPRTSVGKIDKRSLRDLHASGSVRAERVSG